MGTGRGVALEPRAMPDLSGTPLLLVNPRRGLSTPLVFSCWDGQDRGPLQADNLDQIVSEGRNDLQPPAITLLPEIGDVLAVLDGLDGIRLARMSGSGASCFRSVERRVGKVCVGPCRSRWSRDSQIPNNNHTQHA